MDAASLPYVASQDKLDADVAEPLVDLSSLAADDVRSESAVVVPPRWPLRDAGPAQAHFSRPQAVDNPPCVVRPPPEPACDEVRFLFRVSASVRARHGSWPPLPPCEVGTIHVNAPGTARVMACKPRDRRAVHDLGTVWPHWFGATLCRRCTSVRPQAVALTL